MSFDRDALIDACKAHGVVARVVVARLRGSGPREVGASMLVWANGMSGTIGGGTLEHQAIVTARKRLTPGTYCLTQHSLGPDLGQCCGGAVDLVTHVFDLPHAKAVDETLVAHGTGDMPRDVARLKTQARNSGVFGSPQLISGWMVEPVTKPERDIWIWGAGHVGRALVGVLSPLPGLQLTWVDTSPERFPKQVPDRTRVLTTRQPEALIQYAPAQAEHLIVTYSHALDLELCHRLLLHGFSFAGLIGSKTKWARFRKRLSTLGHQPDAIGRITCPIGKPELGKHPQTIALGVSMDILSPAHLANRLEDIA